MRKQLDQVLSLCVLLDGAGRGCRIGDVGVADISFFAGLQVSFFKLLPVSLSWCLRHPYILIPGDDKINNYVVSSLLLQI